MYLKGNVNCRAKNTSFLIFFIFLLCLQVHAEETLENLKSRLTDSRDIKRAKVAAEIALALRQSDADQALRYARIALIQLQKTPHNPTHVSVMNTLAIAHLQKREYEKTVSHAEQALHMAANHTLVLEQARALNTLGALSWYRGNLDEAKKHFEASLKLREQVGAYKEMSPALNNLGVLEEIQGHYNKAIQFYLKAIDYAERVGDNEQLSRPISNLGILHQMLENYDKALAFYQRSLDLKLKAGNLVGVALAYNNIRACSH